MHSLSKAKLKIFASLHLKKFRQAQGLFLVEGKKMVEEALKSEWELEAVIIREKSAKNLTDQPGGIPPEKLQTLDEDQFNRLSSLTTPEGVMAVIRIPGPERYLSEKNAGLSLPVITGRALLLEDIHDPGNLGTLIRTADWFGIKTLVCSADTADCFNPKVLRSSMGSIFRTRIIYMDRWEDFVTENAHRVWVAHMHGNPLPEVAGDNRDFILLGSEAQGVKPSTLQIPGILPVRIPGVGGAESLNAAIAGAIMAYAMCNPEKK